MKGQVTFYLPILTLLTLIVSCEENAVQPTDVAENQKKDLYRIFKTEQDPAAKAVLDQFLASGDLTSGRALKLLDEDVDLSVGTATEMDSISIYSFDIETHEVLVVENLVLSEVDGQVFNYIIQFKADSSWLAKNSGFFDWSTFTGSVSQFDIEGNLISINYMTEGQNFISIADGDTTSSGRVMADKCCWRTTFSTVTGQPMAILDCGAGDDLIYFGVDMGNFCYSTGGGITPTSPTGPSPSPFNPTPTGGGGTGTGSPSYPVILPGSLVMGLYSPSTFIYSLSPNQSTFSKISYSSSTPAQRTAHTLNYVRYCKKNNIAVNIRNIFSDLPTGKVYDIFSTAVLISNTRVNLTRVEMPLDSQFTTFNSSIHRTTQVKLSDGAYYRNIEFSVPCGGCSYPMKSLMLQVPESQFNTIYNFLRGI